MPELDFSTHLDNARTLRSQGVRGRYAPSPTGSLHLGNLSSALYAWLQVRLADGVLVMRMEDLDERRAKEGSAEEILDDLRWLGLDWDEGPEIGGPAGPYTQSQRGTLYRQALEILRDQELIFRCFCSRKDVREAASAPHGSGGGVIYPGTCRNLDPDEQVEHQARHPDRKPALRVIAPDKDISLRDRIAGPYSENIAGDVGDFVVRRSDQVFAYQMAVVVDDALMGITDVVRGADLLPSTPRQIALYELFGAEVPRFWHAPMVVDDDGEPLSKRDGSRSLRELRDAGWDAPRVIGHLAASLGWVDEGARLSADELAAELDEKDLTDPNPTHIPVEASTVA